MKITLIIYNKYDFFMLFMQKERYMSEYIGFITYQDDAII